MALTKPIRRFEMWKTGITITCLISIMVLTAVDCATLEPAPPQPEVLSLPPAKSDVFEENKR